HLRSPLGHLPEADAPAGGGGRQGLAVGAERQAEDPSAVAVQGRHFFPGGGVPDLDATGFRRAARREILPVGTERQVCRLERELDRPRRRLLPAMDRLGYRGRRRTTWRLPLVPGRPESEPQT